MVQISKCFVFDIGAFFLIESNINYILYYYFTNCSASFLDDSVTPSWTGRPFCTKGKKFQYLNLEELYRFKTTILKKKKKTYTK